MPYCGDYDAYDGDLNPEIYMRPKGRSIKMATRVTGIVEKAFRNPKNGLCSLLINDVWYSTYQTLYSECEGKMVEIEATQKGKYWNCNGEPKVLATPAPSTPAVSGGVSTPDARQASIVLQSSYKTAAELTVGLLANGVLTIPQKKGDQYDAVLNYVDEIALRLFRNCINPTPFVSEEQEEESDNPAPAGWNAAEA